MSELNWLELWSLKQEVLIVRHPLRHEIIVKESPLKMILEAWNLVTVSYSPFQVPVTSAKGTWLVGRGMAIASRIHPMWSLTVVSAQEGWTNPSKLIFKHSGWGGFQETKAIVLRFSIQHIISSYISSCYCFCFLLHPSFIKK